MPLRKEMAVFTLLLALILLPMGSAAKLGVNYYHESMMSDQWKLQYLEVNLTQAATDFDNIKTIAMHVKFYMNPLIDQNLPWVKSLVGIAKQKGMNVVVTMNVDDRTLSYSNWGIYESKVISACADLNGKVDGILVGNEISLHSDISGQEIQTKLVSLINSCKTKFNGQVSYEGFWYEKDFWKNYKEPIYFNLYEGTDQFKYNLNELNSFFGQNGYIGEWGVSLLDGGVEHDDFWQKNQIQERWDAIQKTNSPVAYIFAYREPSWNGFGIIRPDGIKRPLWDIFTQSQTLPVSSSPVSAPTTNIDVSLLSSLVASCNYNSNILCTKKTDYISGSCRTISFTTPNGEINMLACIKSKGIEIYRTNYPTNIKFKACLDSSCITELAGFSLVSLTSTTSSTSTSFSISDLLVSCNVDGQSCSKTSDLTSGSCRSVTFSSSSGNIKVEGCDKGNGYAELYLKQAPIGKYQICFANGCITELSGFVKFQPSSTSTNTQSEQKKIDVSSLSVSVNPSGSKVLDFIEGNGCRKVQFSTSAGWLEARICPKTNNYEMYFLSGTSHASICVGSYCVNSAGGFVSFS